MHLYFGKLTSLEPPPPPCGVMRGLRPYWGKTPDPGVHSVLLRSCFCLPTKHVEDHF